jgi:hypothetical protein
MPRRLVSVILVALVAPAAGCTFLDPEPTTTTATTEANQGIVATTSAPPTTLSEDSPCLAGDRPFTAAGLISAFGGNDGDATQISAIRWSAYPGCEQLTVEFLTADGAPAGGLDPVGVEYEAASGVIRVSLPAEVNRSAVADSLVDGDLVNRAYVVSTGDTLAIDVHLAAGRSYGLRAYDVDSPSRIVIDITEDPEAQPVLGATAGNDVVVVTPAAGPVQASFVVEGYVKGPYDSVTLDLVSQADGAVAATETVTPAAGEAIWREFTVPFRQVPPLPLLLRVTPGNQEQSAVTVRVNASPGVPADPGDT